ncbi:MAG: ABC transporter permease [Lachnospiraceae bacterium]|jgi:ribose transport system permease protein|nr:ABC transporter permease [Lachnospiraceae bacterium]
MQSIKLKKNIHNYIVYISFFIVLIGFSIALPGKFLTLPNMLNILRQTAMISVAAVGMVFAITAGQIDLSTGGITALSALVTALVLQKAPAGIGILAGLLVGLIGGALNGFILTKGRIPAFIVTLGTSSIYSGLARAITNLEAVSITNETYNHYFGSGDIGKIPTLFIWTIIIVALGQYVYKKTSFGRDVLSVGGNAAAAKYSGINVDKVKFICMVICAVTASFAGILYAGRMHGARYTLGENDNMNIIAAVVIGGTSFSGGKGTVFGSLLGSLVIGMLNNGLLMLGLSVNAQMVARGIVILAAVLLSLREKTSD